MSSLMHELMALSMLLVGKECGENFQVFRVFDPQNRWSLIAKGIQDGVALLVSLKVS